MHWTDPETVVLLGIVETKLPRGIEEWNAVSTEYNISRLQLPALSGRPERDADSCKTKFKSLKNVRKPTGDPSIPPNVKRAKIIQCSIERKMSALNMDDDENEEVEEEPNDDDDQRESPVDPRHFGLVNEPDHNDDPAEHEAPRAVAIPVTAAPPVAAPGAVPVTTRAATAPVPAVLPSTTPGVAPGKSNPATLRRLGLDDKITEASDKVTDSRNYMQYFLMAETARRETEAEDRREEREERRRENLRLEARRIEAEERRRLDEDRRREADDRRQREEEERRRQDDDRRRQHDLLMMTMMGKLLNKDA